MKMSIDDEHLALRKLYLGSWISPWEIQVVPRPTGVDHREVDEVDKPRDFPVVSDNTVGITEAC